MLAQFGVVLCLLVISSAQIKKNNLLEGEVCRSENGETWTCKKLHECKAAYNKLKTQKPQICSYHHFSVIVCCEPNSFENSNVITTSSTTTNEDLTWTSATTQNSSPPIKPSTTENVLESSSSNNDVRPTEATILQEQPTTLDTNSTSISIRKCREYAQHVFQYSEQQGLSLHGQGEREKENTCSAVETPLIIDGTPVLPREFPHQVGVGFVNDERRVKWNCGGSLISENFVLSAAHCSKSRKYGPPKFVLVGDLNIESTDDDADPEIIEITDIIDHPGYNNDFPYNDIALYRLKRNVRINAYRRPACLHNIFRNKDISGATATGWGNVKQIGPGSSSHLLKVNLDIIPHDVCNKSWITPDLRRGIDDTRMICAGDLLGKKDTCKGDSGGPLQYRMKDPYCMYSIIGVTSFGTKICGNGKPGIYTRVSHYVPWIESIVWPSQ